MTVRKRLEEKEQRVTKHREKTHDSKSLRRKESGKKAEGGKLEKIEIRMGGPY